MATSTLSTTINSLGSLFTGYISVLINDFLPIFLGVVIVVGVVGLIVWGLTSLFRHKK